MSTVFVQDRISLRYFSCKETFMRKNRRRTNNNAPLIYWITRCHFLMFFDSIDELIEELKTLEAIKEERRNSRHKNVKSVRRIEKENQIQLQIMPLHKKRMLQISYS